MSLGGMTRWKGRVALVTGATVGIGSAICKCLLSQGLIVIGCARSEDGLQKFRKECQELGYEGKLVTKRCDVSNETDIDNLFSWIEVNYGALHVCVNNAGFSYKEDLLTVNATQMREMLDVNVVGLVLCSSKAVKSMLAHDVNDGHIFNINSMSGHRLTGALNFYSATKYAVTALTEGLRRELVSKNSRIRVTQVSPGLVETEFSARAFGDKEAKELYQRRGNLLHPQDIADALLFALSAPENAQVHDILMRPTGEPL